LNGGSARSKASAYTGQHNTGKRGPTSMPRAGFVHAIPVFEGPLEPTHPFIYTPRFYHKKVMYITGNIHPTRVYTSCKVMST